MRRTSNIAARLAALLVATAAMAVAGCLELSSPGSSGLSIVAGPDTTPIVIAPLSITVVAGSISSPKGLAYTLTVRNTADTAAGVVAPYCGGIVLRSSPDTTAATVSISFPPCPPVVALTTLQPGQSISLTHVLADSYIAAGTPRGDYYVWVQLAAPAGRPFSFAAAGRVHWGG